MRAQGFSLEQIVQRTGLSYQAVQSLLARARRTLRAALAGTLAIAVWACRGRPWAAGGGAQTATLVSAAVTLAMAGLGLATPSVSEVEAPAPRLRSYVTPLPADPGRASEGRGAPVPYEPISSDLPAEPGHGAVLPTDQGAGAPVTGPEPSAAPSGAPSERQGAVLPAVPPLPEALEPVLPTARDVSVVVPPVPLAPLVELIGSIGSVERTSRLPADGPL